jgi:hypothetical protein
MGDILNRRVNYDEVNQIISRDETVDATGGPKVSANRDHVNELYSAIADQIDEPAFMIDRNPMTAETPTLYTMRNGWFIDARSLEFFEGAAVQTNGWVGNVVCAISFNATTMFGAADIGRTITGGTTGDTGTILAYDDRYALNDQGVVWIRPDDPATDLFDNATEAYTVGGSSAAGAFTNVYDTAGARSGENLWANPFTLGTVQDNTELYIYQDGARVVSREVNPTNREQWWQTDTTVEEGHIDILLAVQESGQLIDQGLINVYARRATSLYDHFQSNQAAGERTPVPIAQGNDNLNDADGHRSLLMSSDSGNFAVGDRISHDATNLHGVITAITGTTPTRTLEYFIAGDPRIDFVNTDTVTNLDDTGTGTVNGAPVDVNGAIAAGITVAFGQTSQDINNGNGSRPYSIIVNCNSQPLADVYKRLKYLTRRGEVSLLNNIEGEAYKGIGTRLTYSGQAGGNWVEGNLVYGQTSGAVARIVADDDQGTTGTLMLMHVKGTLLTTENLGDAPTGPTVTAAIDTITGVAGLTPKPAPFGTFAGGTFFGAIGVYLQNVQGSEATNYQLIDNLGETQIPPNLVSVTVQSILPRQEGTATSADVGGTTLTDTSGLFQTGGTGIPVVRVGAKVKNITDGSSATVTGITSDTVLTHTALTGGTADDWGIGDKYAVFDGDTVLVARVDGNGDIIKNAITAAVQSAGATSFTANAAVPTDTPDAGVVRVLDTGTNVERRYRYSSRTSTVFTLTALTDGTGNPTANDATNGATEMTDTTADFEGGAIPVQVGDQIRNATDGGIGNITAVYNDKVEHTPLEGGTNNDWQTTDTYEINYLTQAYDTADTAYVPPLDSRNITEGVTQLSNTLVFGSNFDVRVVVRQGGEILEFVTSGQVTSGGLTVSAVRAQDVIANTLTN